MSKITRGIRGAVSIAENAAEAINAGTTELLETIIRKNDLHAEDLVSIFFTVTPDLNAGFPAAAARKLGLTDVPLMCATEIDVPGSIPLVVRILVHFNTTKTLQEIQHVYLGEAVKLRPDIKS